MPGWLQAQLDRYQRQLRLAGEGKTLARFLIEKAVATVALPLILLAPYAAALQRPPPLLVARCCSALAGFFIPDLALREQVKQRRERIFLDLPDALSMMALALGAGQSLRQALELAARDCGGPLAVELDGRSRSPAASAASTSAKRSCRSHARQASRTSLASPSCWRRRRAPISTSCARTPRRRAPSRTG